MSANKGNNSAQEVTLKISIDEANLILEGLGLIPFARVYALVNKLQGQASAQLNSPQNNAVETGATANQGVPIVETDAVPSGA